MLLLLVEACETTHRLLWRLHRLLWLLLLGRRLVEVTKSSRGRLLSSLLRRLLLLIEVGKTSSCLSVLRLDRLGMMLLVKV